MSQLEFSLGKNCGVTFAGIKIASLFRLKKIHADELGYYEECFAKKGFKFVVMRDDGDWLLLFVYHCERLEKRLSESECKQFLRDCGYDYADADEAVSTLKLAFGREGFPHEIGVFLGYNLDDVKSFISHPDEGVVLTGCWKVYHDADCKAELFRRYDKCSHCICEKLLGGIPLTRIFNVA